MSITPDCREISQEELDAIVIERDILRTKVQHLTEELTNEQRVVAGFRILLQDARDEVHRLEGVVTRLREIEVSEEVYGFMSAHGIDGRVLICGEFRGGREFKEKFKARPRTPQSVEVPEFSRKLTEADLTKWLRVDKRWTAFVNGFHECLRRLDEAVERSRLVPAPPQAEPAKMVQFRQDWLAIPRSPRNDALVTHAEDGTRA